MLGSTREAELLRDYDSDEPALVAAQDQLVAAMGDAARPRASGHSETSHVDIMVLTAFGSLVELERVVRERDNAEE